VTEAEWLACADPMRLLAALSRFRAAGEPGRRKERLFACACCRRGWARLTDPRSRTAVEAAELFADGLLSAEGLQAARAAAAEAALAAGEARRASGRAWSHTRDPVETAADAALCACGQAELHPGEVGLIALRTGELYRSGRAPSRRQELALVRDIFGNPFRPAPFVSPAWLAWGGGVVADLARAAYEERRLPPGRLDGHRLLVLADALEEAGCAAAALLEHLRGPGPHVRGCWVVDLLLGKG
jgi:hypothetical protein